MHLVNKLVLGIGQGLEVVVVVGPFPGTGVGIAFDENVLVFSAGRADAVDGGLVKVEDEGLVHVVVLVVCILSTSFIGRRCR